MPNVGGGSVAAVQVLTSWCGDQRGLAARVVTVQQRRGISVVRVSSLASGGVTADTGHLDRLGQLSAFESVCVTARACVKFTVNTIETRPNLMRACLCRWKRDLEDSSSEADEEEGRG